MRQPDWQTADGSIRLYCGDCLDLLPQLEAGSVGAIVTDPPYEMGIERVPIYGNRKTYTNSRTIGKAWEVNFDWIAMAGEVQPRHWAICCGYKDIGPTQLAVEDFASVSALFTWRKENAPSMTRPIPRMDCEYVLWARHDKATCGRMGEFNSTVISIPMPYAGIGGGERIRQWDNGPALHPSQKPVALMQLFTDRLECETVCDPYMGLGTTGVACVRTGRRFIGMELERRYFDIAVSRIEAELNRFPLIEERPAVQRELLEVVA